jgi:hypothetical protein
LVNLLGIENIGSQLRRNEDGGRREEIINAVPPGGEQPYSSVVRLVLEEQGDDVSRNINAAHGALLHHP